MYSNTPRPLEYQSRLLAFIAHQYNIAPQSLTPAKRGYYGETWCLNTARARYFVKLVYPAPNKAAYERSFPVIQHLCDHGIDFISRIVKTRDDRLSARFDGAALGIFQWIDGENVETDATKIPEYQMLAQVYTVPTHGLSIPREDFSGAIAGEFIQKWNALGDGPLRSLLEKNRHKLEHRAHRLTHFANLCQGDNAAFVITHGDAGGNLVVSGDRYFIVDWDIPLLAPPERDAWVMCSRDWARDAFEGALRQNGIEHTLRRAQLAYYCYHFYLFYLVAYMDGQADVGTVAEFIDGWMKDSIGFADG